jgi:hypothetical protein
MNQALRYTESQLAPLLNKHVEDCDLYSYLSGGGGTVVDAALYLIPPSGKFLRTRLPAALAS